MDVQQINLTIDGIAVSVPKGTTVYKAITQLGIDVPIFCYQDRMPPFGACRVCLVEVEKMAKLQTSCTLEATEGMVVKTQSNPAVAGREEILEFLLINHPLDCPICDRGGECPLQDQVVKFGPGASRFYEEKRHFTKPLPLGPVLMLDRERCIVCARCTRFSDLVAGDHALELHDRGYRTEVGTPNHEPVESKFIGNTIMICPVGALTSQVYRFRARPWDNLPTETTCTLCPVGCSMILDSRDGEIMRTRSLENKDVNDIWLCDKGWFGYEFVTAKDRLQQPLIRRSGKLEPATWDEALTLIASKIKTSERIAALGGNPLTIEENYLFQQLMREIVHTNNIDHRVGTPMISLNEEGIAPGMEMTIGDSENLSFAILFGIDLTEEFPVIWLRLKQAINKGATVLFFGNYAPEIASQISNVILHPPGSEVEVLKEHLDTITKLAAKGKGAFFVGRQYLANANRQPILSELMKIRQSHISLNILEGNGNSMGARFAGMRPDIGPFGKKIDQPGFNTIEILENAASTGWDFLYVAGANVAAKVPSILWKEVRKKLQFLVVQDLFLTETANHADVVLPTLCFVEKDGHFMNIEGRLQKLQPGKIIPHDILSDAEIFNLLAQKLGSTLTVDSEIATKKMQRTEKIESSINHASKPDSDRLLASFAPALFDKGVRMKHDPHLAKLAKEPKIRLNEQEASKRDLLNGDMVRVSHNGQSIVGKLQLDKAIADRTVVLPLGFDQIPVQELGTNLLNGLEVDIKKEYQHKFNHAL